jgi:hypothetical protein
MATVENRGFALVPMGVIATVAHVLFVGAPVLGLRASRRAMAR